MMSVVTTGESPVPGENPHPTKEGAWVVALAALLFLGMTLTGTFPLGPSNAGAAQYCTQYQYNTCGALVPPLIAFHSDRDGAANTEVYLMNGDGSTQTRLFANTNQADTDPSWSPDGNKIAFASFRNANSEIYAMNANGSAQTRLTNNAAIDIQPSWSPAGPRIAFTSSRDGNFEIYAINADGSLPTRLTTDAAPDSSPSWSPAGTTIAFTSSRDGNSEIYSMNANGSGQARLTNNAAVDSGASWSPDGTKIAFSSNRDGNTEIYVMNANGSAQTRLTNNAASDSVPSWSPDGTKIAFSSNRDGNNEIYAMNANGSAQTRLTNSATSESSPDWQRSAPAAPSNLTATSLSSSRIGLSWTDNATNESGFRIERSLDGSTGWSQIGTVAANVTAFTHARQRPLTTLHYRVRATSGGGNSGYTNVASATTFAVSSLPQVAPAIGDRKALAGSAQAPPPPAVPTDSNPPRRP